MSTKQHKRFMYDLDLTAHHIIHLACTSNYGEKKIDHILHKIENLDFTLKKLDFKKVKIITTKCSTSCEYFLPYKCFLCQLSFY